MYHNPLKEKLDAVRADLEDIKRLESVPAADTINLDHIAALELTRFALTKDSDNPKDRVSRRAAPLRCALEGVSDKVPQEVRERALKRAESEMRALGLDPHNRNHVSRYIGKIGAKDGG